MSLHQKANLIPMMMAMASPRPRCPIFGNWCRGPVVSRVLAEASIGRVSKSPPKESNWKAAQKTFGSEKDEQKEIPASYASPAKGSWLAPGDISQSRHTRQRRG
jgi:hypothetical protein